ncbi:RNA polymerase sigma factor [Puteibacter caeruleilacunae]|nr:RNA polymerase sigma factor [Puteibacter caeruleilacunae]
MMNERNDIYYIDEVKNGNRNAFGVLVERYQDMVYGLAYKMMRNESTAEEIAQESFVKAFRSIHTFKGSSKFSTYLYSIVYNTAITELRKKKIHATPVERIEVEPEEEQGVHQEFFNLKAEERKKYLDLAMSKLSPEEQVMMTMFYYDEEPMDEIALVVGLSTSNVKVKIHRSRKKLFKELYVLLNQEIYSLL